MEPRLPIGYAVFSGVFMFLLAGTILGLEVSTKVDLESATKTEILTYDITSVAMVCSFYIGLAVLTIVSSCTNGLRILQQISALHFIGIFLSFLIWVPRCNGLRVLELNSVVPPFPLIISKLISVFVLSIVESLLCFLTVVVSLSKLNR